MARKPKGEKVSADQLAHTRLEPEEVRELAREAQRALLTRKAPAAPKSVGRRIQDRPGTEAVPPSTEPPTLTERPEFRPPLALLNVLDDGKSEGECHRLRNERYVLGRSEGDILIGHDNMISSRHAELVRLREDEGYRWYLQDLESSNGTFVRIGGGRLTDQAELILGRGHYRFEAGAATENKDAQAAPPRHSTDAWQAEPLRTAIPAFAELSPAGTVKRHPLMLAEYWIGRNHVQCAISRPHDMWMNPRHARLYRNAKGIWHIENHHSLNGVWLRVDRIGLDNYCQFRLGEQVFMFRVG